MSPLFLYLCVFVFLRKMKLLRFVCLFCAVIFGSTAMAQSQDELQQLMRNRGEYYFTLSVDDSSQIQELSRICYEGASPAESLSRLMTRPQRHERERFWNR